MRAASLAPLLSLAVSCGGELTPREAEVASVIARSDLAVIRAREPLARGKYARMAARVHDFYRGTFPLFVHDVRNHAVVVPDALAGLPLPVALGDAHVENFGVLRASDGALLFEPNDFDAADRWPQFYDLARLSGSLVLSARASNSSDLGANQLAREAERAIAAAAFEAYATTLVGMADGDLGRERGLPGGDAGQ